MTDPLTPPAPAPEASAPEALHQPRWPEPSLLPHGPEPSPTSQWPELSSSPRERRVTEPLTEPPAEPLYDPYLLAPAPPPAGLSRLAVSALVAAFLGPVGAILAIAFGHYGRREIEQSGHRRSGYALATAGMVLGVVFTMGWGGLLSYVAWTVRYRADPSGDEPGIAAPAAPTPPRRGAPPAVDKPPPADLGPFAPKYTKVKRIGGITVTDIGMSSSSLGDELARQRAEASAANETMLVMTTANGCDPCRGVDGSLADPLLQSALDKVRLVRVDVHAFHEDLEQLKIPDEMIPGFFLLSLDLTPRDGVNGGEWDEDIPVNIAPVLGPFMRRQYTQRKQPFQPVPASGMAL